MHNTIQRTFTPISRNYYLKRWTELKMKTWHFQNGGILVCVWKENAHRTQQRGLLDVRSALCKGIETMYLLTETNMRVRFPFRLSY